MQEDFTIYLLSIRGKLAPNSLEEARIIHNQTAGNPDGVEAARSLGDLSHKVHIPLGQQEADDFLILDLWYSVEGLNTFFSDPNVQQGASMIFTERDPVVWRPADGFNHYHLPRPDGQTNRIVGTVRGTMTSLQKGRSAHNQLVASLANKARRRGHVSHQAYLRLTPPGEPASLEFFGVDVWMNEEGMMEHYQDPDFQAQFPSMFDTFSSGVWQHPGSDWVEW